MAEFLAMDGYGAYVWSAYALSAVGLTAIGVWPLARLRALARRLRQAARPRPENTKGSP